MLDPQSRSYGTQRAVLRTLQAIRDPAAFQPLVDYIEKNGRYATQAVSALGAVRHPEAGKYLLEQFKKAGSSTAATYLHALVETGDAAVLGSAALAGASKTEQGGYTRTIAAQLLGRYRPKGAFSALSALLEEPTVRRDTRYRAIEALGVLGDPRARTLLLALADKPADRHDALRALAHSGETEALAGEVEAELARVAATPEGDANARNALGIELTTLQRFDAAREQFQAMLKANPRNDTAYYNLACVEALSGHPDQALDLMKKARELGYRDWQHIELDHDFTSLRENPGYRTMIDEMRDPYAIYQSSAASFQFDPSRAGILLPGGVGGKRAIRRIGGAGKGAGGVMIRVPVKPAIGEAQDLKPPAPKKPAPGKSAEKSPAPKAGGKAGEDAK